MQGPRSGHLFLRKLCRNQAGDRYAAPAFPPPHAIERSPLRGYPPLRLLSFGERNVQTPDHQLKRLCEKLEHHQLEVGGMTLHTVSEDGGSICVRSLNLSHHAAEAGGVASPTQ